MRSVLITAALVLACGVGEARANLITFGSVGGAPTGVTLDNLDWLTLGAAGGTSGDLTVFFEGNAQAVQGTVTSQYAAPYLSGLNGAGFGNLGAGQDATTYITSGYGGTAAATLVFSSPQQYFGLLWGSIDAYNTLTFYNGSNPVGSLTGSQFFAESGGMGVNGTLYLNVNSDIPFDRVVATSSSPALEFDNVAYNPTTVPDPPSLLALLMAGLGLAGASRRWRRT